MSTLYRVVSYFTTISLIGVYAYLWTTNVTPKSNVEPFIWIGFVIGANIVAMVASVVMDHDK